MSGPAVAIMHAAALANPFGAALCGASEGWRTQIATDVSCLRCQNLLDMGEEDTHFAMWEVEQ